MLPVTVSVLSWPLPIPLPLPPPDVAMVATMVDVPHEPDVVQVTVAEAGMVQIGVVPLVQRYTTGVLPVAGPAALGSITPPLVWTVTIGVWPELNLQTPDTVAFTVTVRLSAAFAGMAANSVAAAKTRAAEKVGVWTR